MSRSGYSDDCDGWALIRWRGAVKQAIRGKRGQAFLREALATLDAMPEKKLVADSLHDPVVGQFCTLGAVGAARGMELSAIDPDDRESVAGNFGISEALAAEIMYENDFTGHDQMTERVVICGPMRPHYPEWGQHERSFIVDNPRAGEIRWSRMRSWIESQINKKPEAA